MTPKATHSYSTSYGNVTVTTFAVTPDPDPVRGAIDTAIACGGDAEDVMKALDAAGYVIVPKEPTEAMCEAGAKFYQDNWRKGHAKEDTSMALIWADMIDVATKA